MAAYTTKKSSSPRKKQKSGDSASSKDAQQVDIPAAVGEDGDITVSLAMEHGVPALLIEDSGGGIPSDVAPRLFTSFFSTKPNGQGIGLTLVQEILIAHGFDYSLETVAPGRAGFRIRFSDKDPQVAPGDR